MNQPIDGSIKAILVCHVEDAANVCADAIWKSHSFVSILRHLHHSCVCIRIYMYIHICVCACVCSHSSEDSLAADSKLKLFSKPMMTITVTTTVTLPTLPTTTTTRWSWCIILPIGNSARIHFGVWGVWRPWMESWRTKRRKISREKLFWRCRTGKRRIIWASRFNSLGALTWYVCEFCGMQCVIRDTRVLYAVKSTVLPF